MVPAVTLELMKACVKLCTLWLKIEILVSHSIVSFCCVEHLKHACGNVNHMSCCVFFSFFVQITVNMKAVQRLSAGWQYAQWGWGLEHCRRTVLGKMWHEAQRLWFQTKAIEAKFWKRGLMSFMHSKERNAFFTRYTPVNVEKCVEKQFHSSKDHGINLSNTEAEHASGTLGKDKLL